MWVDERMFSYRVGLCGVIDPIVQCKNVVRNHSPSLSHIPVRASDTIVSSSVSVHAMQFF